MQVVSNAPPHWAASIVDAILKRQYERYNSMVATARTKLRADMLGAINKQLVQTLEAELSVFGKLKYSRIKPNKRLNFLIAEVTDSQVIFENVVKSFIIKFA